MQTITAYKPLPVRFTHGKGIWLYDESGKAYLDALSGIAVTGLGHAHSAVTQAISEQAQKLIHTSNIFEIEAQYQLAEKLTQLTGMQQVFFSNSGAEANEAAIKLARLFGHHKGIDNPHIIVTENAFHGRTLATLSATGNRKVQKGFEPLVSGFVRAPFNDLEAIDNIALNDPNVCAIFVEPIQGEGGINLPDAGYVKKLREICNKHDWLLMLDEIQTGNGRTGNWYAYMHEDIIPDVMTTAKGLGNGMPIGACLMANRACDLFTPGKHGSTFGGNPLACRTALTVLETIESGDLLTHVNKIACKLKSSLTEKLHNHPDVVEIRGQGLMLGIELKNASRELMLQGLEHGILFNLASNNVLRLLPPLIITENECEKIVSRLLKVFT